MACCVIMACSGLEGSAMFSVQEPGEAKESCLMAGGVAALSRKGRFEKRSLGRLMAIQLPFCGQPPLSLTVMPRVVGQRNQGWLDATGLA